MLLELGETQNIPLSDRDFSYTPASLFGASSDTTASTLCFAFFALITHPETPKTAQAKLALRLRIFPFQHPPMRFAPYSYNAFELLRSDIKSFRVILPALDQQYIICPHKHR